MTGTVITALHHVETTEVDLEMTAIEAMIKVARTMTGLADLSSNLAKHY